MFNRQKHQLIMGRILQDIYSDTSVSSLMGLKGGTCAYFFYELPRFSVDLDFDLFKADDETQKTVFEKVKSILEKHGAIKDSRIKRFTIFFLLSYGDDDHNIKVEINARMLMDNIRDQYEMKEYLGISMFVAKKEYLFGSKLAALPLRTTTAMRDIYDAWFFAKNNWDINTDAVKAISGKNIKDNLAECIAIVERVKDNEILGGLGELLDEKQKAWVKTGLRKEARLLLKNYQSALK